ncbi:MAG: hypothetical protein AMJ90_06795 [candidate division Zixibacteria bacterium SM23_73_2]|nr:MAG: hypothetical protein AMJ90_06795 [candidate division Zixibacteria bacterium SM23_73_2]
MKETKGEKKLPLVCGKEAKKIMKKNIEKKDKNDDISYALTKLTNDAYYGYQGVRIAQQNRIRDIVRRKTEGIPLSKPEEKKDKKNFDKKFNDKKLPFYLGKLVLKNKITENEKQHIQKLFELSKETKKIEQKYKKMMEECLKYEKIYNQWLKKLKGIGTVLSSNLLKNFGYCEITIFDSKGNQVCSEIDDLEKTWKLLKEIRHDGNKNKLFYKGYPHVSSLWRHCGLDPEGAQPKNKGKKIHYNPKLKTLAWKIADSFFMKRTPVYRSLYDQYLARQYKLIDDHDKKAAKNKKHACFRSRRRMVKIFLAHYWSIARRMKGLPVTNPYAIDKIPGHSTYVKPPFNPFSDSDNPGVSNEKG